SESGPEPSSSSTQPREKGPLATTSAAPKCPTKSVSPTLISVGTSEPSRPVQIPTPLLPGNTPKNRLPVISTVERPKAKKSPSPSLPTVMLPALSALGTAELLIPRLPLLPSSIATAISPALASDEPSSSISAALLPPLLPIWTPATVRAALGSLSVPELSTERAGV